MRRVGEGRRFVLFDRDGTLIESHHYLADPAKVRLLPRAGEGLRRLAAMGLGLVVVTNQSAVARGRLGLDGLRAIHDRLADELARERVRLDGLYFCPHHPDDGCACRKPRTGMVERAAEEHGFSPGDSFVIGDDACDVDLGRACGATTLLVSTGFGDRVRRERLATPDHLVDDLVQAAEVIWDNLRRTADPRT